jgi:hypothetical protein
MARAAERRPDVALVDVHIRGRLDGNPAAQLLHERFRVPRRLPHAHMRRRDRAEGAATHPYGYLVKPVAPPSCGAPSRSRCTAPREADGRRGRRRRGPRRRGHGGMAGPPGARAVAPPARPDPSPAPTSDAPRRSRDFLRFVVDEALAGRGEAISQGRSPRTVFGRKGRLRRHGGPHRPHPRRGRLRRSLERFYLLSGKETAVADQSCQGDVRPDLPRRGGRSGGPPPRRPRPGGVRAAWIRRGRLAVGRRGWLRAVGPSSEAADLARDVSEELGARARPIPRRARGARLSDLGGRDPLPPAVPASRSTARLRRGRGEDLRVTARLVDRVTGEHIWGDEYHTVAESGPVGGSPEDVARVIAARVGAEEGVVVPAPGRPSGWKAPARRGRHPTTPSSAPTTSSSLATQRPFGPALEALRRVVQREAAVRPGLDPARPLYLADYTFEVTKIPWPSTSNQLRPRRRAFGSRQPQRPAALAAGPAGTRGSSPSCRDESNPRMA